jgi:mono/diheme cytochrome c family protein
MSMAFFLMRQQLTSAPELGLRTWLCKFLPIAFVLAPMLGCKASAPSRVEEKVVQETKELVIGGKDWQNPVADNDSAQQSGAEHFQHHCQICHGLDGQNTGVPFAEKMSPPVANLAMQDVQQYTDGQLKWIIENGIRMSGMPGWKGVLDDTEMWQIVRYIRHLPQKGSLGVPAVFAAESAEHDHAHNAHEHPSAGKKAHR